MSCRITFFANSTLNLSVIILFCVTMNWVVICIIVKIKTVWRRGVVAIFSKKCSLLISYNIESESDNKSEQLNVFSITWKQKNFFRLRVFRNFSVFCRLPNIFFIASRPFRLDTYWYSIQSILMQNTPVRWF